MLFHADFSLAQFHSRERELIAEADRYRLLASARRALRRGGREADARTARGRPDGTLITCAPREAAPARS